MLKEQVRRSAVEVQVHRLDPLTRTLPSALAVLCRGNYISTSRLVGCMYTYVSEKLIVRFEDMVEARSLHLLLLRKRDRPPGAGHTLDVSTTMNSAVTADTLSGVREKRENI